MNLQDIPTPETDAALIIDGISYNMVPRKGLPDMVAHARSLERRLAVCREALEKIATGNTDDHRTVAQDALTLTKHKP